MKNKKERTSIIFIDYISNVLKKCKHFICLGERKQLSKNIIYKNSHIGERCFILGNGPSLNDFDLSALKNEIVYCVNEFYRFDKFDAVNPNYLFLADPAYFKFDCDDFVDKDFSNSIKKVISGNVDLWIPYGFKAVCDAEFESYDKIHYFQNNLVYKNTKRIISFDKCIPVMQNVIQYAILHAVYSGFKEIYMLGVEQTDIIPIIESYHNSDVEYYYAFDLNQEEKKWKFDLTMEYSLSDMLYGFARIFELYDDLYDYCNFHNVKIVNCSPGSLIKSIPFEQWKFE